MAALYPAGIEMERDKSRFAGIQDTEWTVIPIVVADEGKVTLVREVHSSKKFDPITCVHMQ